MNNYLTQNSYLNTSLLSQQFNEAMKAQERLAIKGIIEAKKSKIRSLGNTLSQELSDQKTKMKDFAGNTVSSNFKEGLSGQAAEAAETYLKSNKFHPNLKSPVKK